MPESPGESGLTLLVTVLIFSWQMAYRCDKDAEGLPSHCRFARRR
jgi:hypothetical protein